MPSRVAVAASSSFRRSAGANLALETRDAEKAACVGEVLMPARTLIAIVLALTGAACASLGPLGEVIQPPRFAEARDRANEVRLLSPSLDQPLGGAAVRVWARVSNPNPFGFTLSTLRAELSLEGTRAATGDFPLGLPLGAGGESVIPLDLSISFADLPRLAEAIRRAASGRPLAYDVAGTIGVEAGPLGRPTFGPMPLFRGEVMVRR
jgi:hypothetical protein